MSDTIIFSGLYSLDFSAVRENVIRIPEVVQAIREAQESWDKNSEESFDFMSFLLGDDGDFISDIRLKSVTSAVVQAGLFRRYLKRNNPPQFIAGSSVGDSPLPLIAGQQTLGEFVSNSEAIRGVGESSPEDLCAGVPQLAGVGLNKFSCIKVCDSKASSLYENEVNLPTILAKLLDTQGATRFINLGPGQASVNRHDLGSEFEQAEFVDAIDIDPLLTWFWPSVRGSNKLAI